MTDAPARPRVLGVLLAAGGSRRLGHPKQVVLHRGVPLVRAAARAACASACTDVVVVVGAREAEVRAALGDLAVEVLANPAWATGMASSVRCGVAHASAGAYDAVLLLVCDQPALTASHLDRLLDAWVPGRAVASRYDAVVGVPALFDRAAFPALLALEGADGAKHVLRAMRDVVAVDWPEGACDVDTPEDAARLTATPAR